MVVQWWSRSIIFFFAAAYRGVLKSERCIVHIAASAFANKRVALSRQANACIQTRQRALLYTNPSENVYRLSRYWEREREVRLNPRSGWHHEASRDPCSFLYLYLFFLHNRKPLRTAIYGMEWEKDANLCCTPCQFIGWYNRGY